MELREWIGRREEADDVVTRGPLERLAATLDHDDPPWRPEEVPPLGHWLFFLPRTPQRDIAPDGHAHRGGFLPPVTLRRRMWAGSRVDFLMPMRIGDRIHRTSTVADVSEKSGRKGTLVFVTVVHEITTGGALAVREEQDLVYLDIPKGDDSPADARASVVMPEAQWERAVRLDPVLLFRFSALAFNGHRIHYDRDYCRDVEGYPGLVVHAPLAATLLMDHFLRRIPRAPVRRFMYLAHRPLFDTTPFSLKGRLAAQGALLWAVNDADVATMTAELETGERPS